MLRIFNRFKPVIFKVVIVIVICSVTLLGAGAIASLSDETNRQDRGINASQPDALSITDIEENESEQPSYDHMIPDDPVPLDDMIDQDDLNDNDDLADPEDPAIPDDLIIPEDIPGINGMIAFNNKIYSIDGQTYFGMWEDLYRTETSSDPTEFEHIFRADHGQLRGNGLNNLIQCGEYLVFTQGSYIYKMHRVTSEITVLLSAEKAGTCFVLDVKDDTIYFTGYDSYGDFTDDIYKINISGDNLSRVNAVDTGDRPFSVKIYNDWIFYITETGIYRIKVDGTEKEKIFSAGFNYMETGLVVTGGYIYYIANRYTPEGVLYRMDIDGENKIELAQNCYDFTILGEWVFYTEFDKEELSNISYVHGKGIFKVKTDGSFKEMIYEGLAEIGGVSNDWIYYSVYDTKVYRTEHFLIRIDGTDKMVIKPHLA